jgi:hypothetical protein
MGFRVLLILDPYYLRPSASKKHLEEFQQNPGQAGGTLGIYNPIGLLDNFLWKGKERGWVCEGFLRNCDIFIRIIRSESPFWRFHIF